jgi:hypothetical protein
MIKKILSIIFIYTLHFAYASTPVWTFTPLTTTSGLAPINVSIQVKYRITNVSKKTHHLVLSSIPGITQDTSGSNCQNPFTLASHQSCVLVLTLNGTSITSLGGIFGGPVVCETNAAQLQCNQPSLNNQLNIQPGNAVSIGDTYGGGKVACLNGGLNNLIAADADFNSIGVVWSNVGSETLATSYTDGAANTNKIVDCLTYQKGCPNPPTSSVDINSYAAGVCASYKVNPQGGPCTSNQPCYDDWFLPAVSVSNDSGQLNCLYTNRNAVGGFNSTQYWSSTEGNGISLESTYAWFKSFDSIGSIDGYPKNRLLLVRCVRAFTP